MSANDIIRLGSLRDANAFEEYLRRQPFLIPCDLELLRGSQSPLSQPLARNDIRIGNRIATQPMEGWDGTVDGNPTESTFRRWKRFGQSGAKLIWGGEAVAVRPDARANPNQLLAGSHTREGLARLRATLIEEHKHVTGSDDGLLIGLQLTHSGRYCRPTAKGREPRILYRHPLLDGRLGLPADYPVLTDGEIREIIEDFHRAARLAWELDFDFVDIKHCHGYLGHEFLSAYTREGPYGGSFENRTRFLREVIEGIRSITTNLKIGVRLSAFDTVPFRADPACSSPGKQGPGISEPYDAWLPYRWGFGVNPSDPRQQDLAEPLRFLALLEELNVPLVNISAGSPYYNPHIQRPAFYPPSDGYQPPEDPVAGVARQMETVRRLKNKFPKLILVGSAYSYLQDFLPHVAQAAVRQGWVDCVGLGRMLLTYPELLWNVLQGQPVEHKRVCRTFSDCTTAPRNGLPSGCYPLDGYYKRSELGARLREIKSKR